MDFDTLSRASIVIVSDSAYPAVVYRTLTFVYVLAYAVWTFDFLVACPFSRILTCFFLLQFPNLLYSRILNTLKTLYLTI